MLCKNTDMHFRIISQLIYFSFIGVNVNCQEKEAQCCQEIEGCKDASSVEIVIQEVGEVQHCITLHPGFSSVCLAPWSLHQGGRKFHKIDGERCKVMKTGKY
jgi:hypothetical protein